MIYVPKKIIKPKKAYHYFEQQQREKRGNERIND